MDLRQTLASRWAQEVLEQEFPGLVYSITNCRPIRSCPHVPRHPSQHSHGNALDIFVRFANDPTPEEQAQLDLVDAFLMENQLVLNVRASLWRIPSHFNHIHVDFFPKLIYAGCGTPSNIWKVSTPPLWKTVAGREFKSWQPRPLWDPRDILSDDMDYRKIIDLWGVEGLTKLRDRGAFSGDPTWYFGESLPSDDKNLVEVIFAWLALAPPPVLGGVQLGDVVRLEQP